MQEARHRDILNIYKFADKTGLGTYASMVRVPEGLIPLDLNREKIELPEPGSAATVDI